MGKNPPRTLLFAVGGHRGFRFVRPSHAAIALGAAPALGTMLAAYTAPGSGKAPPLVGLLLGLALAAGCTGAAAQVLDDLLPGLRRIQRSRRAVTFLTVAGVAGAVAALAWASLSGGIRDLLVPAFIVLSGVWPAVLLARQVTRVERAAGVWAAVGVDLLVSLVLGVAGFLLFNQRFLGATLPAALVVPAAVWSGLLTWRWMTRSSRLWVRAGSDVVLSVTLGVAVVVGLVWVADLADLSVDQVRFTRELLARLSEATDVPGWLWVAAYAALAIAGAVLALRAAQLRALVRRWQALELVPGVGAGERVMSAVHMTLLVTTLVGVAAPPAVALPLQAHARSQYLLATRDELDAEAARAAYEAIRATFTQGQVAPPRVAALGSLLARVRQVAGPDAADERGVAHRLGAIQAAAVAGAAPGRALSARETAAVLGQLAGPIRDAADARRRLDRLQGRQEDAGRARETLRQSAELAASAVANTLSVPALTNAAQLVQEYLAGLVEGSGIADAFFEWAKRRLLAEPAGEEPSAGVDLVMPDPARLRDAARADLEAEARVDLDFVGVLELEQVEVRWLQGPALDGAVELALQADVMHRQWLCQACDAHPPITGLRPRGQQEEGRPGGPVVERPPVVEPHPIGRP